MTPIDWLWLSLLAGFWGGVGQGVRATIGLKKMNDEAGERGVPFAQMFDTARFSVSLVIGVIAGAFAALGMVAMGSIIKSSDPTQLSAILSFMAAGYSGSDYIEGLVSRYLPSSATVPPAGATTPATGKPGEVFHG